jgi:hypothetical protein
MVGWMQAASANSGISNKRRIAAHAKPGEGASSGSPAAAKLPGMAMPPQAMPSAGSGALRRHAPITTANRRRCSVPRPAAGHRRRLLAAVLAAAIVATAGCARAPLVAAITPPPIPTGKARLWFYRIYLPSDTLNMTRVTMNGAYAGYAQLGGAFYRDVFPGVYHIEVESYGRDFGQSTNVALVVRQEAYVQIESLRSWATMPGFGFTAGRDTFYARLIFPWTARAEIAQSFFDGGS